MATPSKERELDQRVATLLPDGEAIDPGEIVEAVESVMTSISGDVAAVNLNLFREIQSLGSFLDEVKAEIAALCPDEITAEHLPTATDELQAIVGATETATNAIFEAVETIEELAGAVESELGGKISKEVTRVYEACSFQDITGQRIGKVVNALQHVENKVGELLEAFGQRVEASEAERRSRKTIRADGKDRPDEHLMSGPQRPEDAISQDDVDALLNSFD